MRHLVAKILSTVPLTKRGTRNWCLYSKRKTYLIYSSSVSVVDFGQAIVWWVDSLINVMRKYEIYEVNEIYGITVKKKEFCEKLGSQLSKNVQ